MKEIPHIKFVVDETPYCFWALNPYTQSLEFLNKLDPGYFEHIANIHSQFLEGDEKQYAAAALRIAYSQGLETLFALLCATAQANDCIIGWFLKYTNRDLFNVVRKISSWEPIYTKLPTKNVTWEYLSNLIFSGLKSGDEEKDFHIIQSFARLWERLADEFLDEKLGHEYNSIKHGLRARMGGFFFAIGPPGASVPPDQMQVVANSTFGSSFFIPIRLQDSRNFSVIHQGINWHPNRYICALKIISISINNIIANLKRSYGIPADELKYSLFSEDSTYEEFLENLGGATSLSFNQPFSEKDITPLTKADILSVYNKKDVNETE